MGVLHAAPDDGAGDLVDEALHVVVRLGQQRVPGHGDIGDDAALQGRGDVDGVLLDDAVDDAVALRGRVLAVGVGAARHRRRGGGGRRGRGGGPGGGGVGGLGAARVLVVGGGDLLPGGAAGQDAGRADRREDDAAHRQGAARPRARRRRTAHRRGSLPRRRVGGAPPDPGACRAARPAALRHASSSFCPKSSISALRRPSVPSLSFSPTRRPWLSRIWRCPQEATCASWVTTMSVVPAS